MGSCCRSPTRWRAAAASTAGGPTNALTVELNSYLYHGSRHAWEQDYERQREAYAREDAFRAYTYRDVFEDPARMLSELRRLLG